MQVRLHRRPSGEFDLDRRESPGVEENVRCRQDGRLGSESGQPFFKRNIAECLWAAISSEQLEYVERFRAATFYDIIFKRRGMDDVYFRILAVPEAIHAAESLGHTLECREIAHHVIGRDIHANFAS